jgi:hypothetical protein
MVGTSSHRPNLVVNVDIPRSDLEKAALARQDQQNAAQVALDQLGRLLNQADQTLTDIEEQDMLGNAIIRGCKDLADGLGKLADQMDQQSDDERRALAQACIEDAHATLLLIDAEEGHGATKVFSRQSSEELYNLSEDHVMNAIHAAATLLRDVEDTLRAIDRNEAEEIADVALTVAHLFVASLQSVHATITPENLTERVQQLQQAPRTNTGPRIELLDSDEDDETPISCPQSPETSKPALISRNARLRVLWPPLGPMVAEKMKWGKESASQKPILAVALGLTLWPWAIVAAFTTAPLVIVDGFIQEAYGNFQDGPVIQGVERTAAQLYQTGRLSFLCSKLMIRQTLRVASRQVKRYGGLGQTAHNIGDWAMERITHPMETAEMVWGGISWGVGFVAATWSQFHDSEQDETVQRLQQ